MPMTMSCRIAITAMLNARVHLPMPRRRTRKSSNQNTVMAAANVASTTQRRQGAGSTKATSITTRATTGAITSLAPGERALVVENLQTTYQVGKGMLAHIQEMARQAAAEDEDDALPEAEAEPEIEAPQDMALAEAETPPPAAETDTANPERADENPDESLYPAASVTRRMRFAFDDSADKLTPTTGTT